MNSAVRSPLRSRSALVATVVPIFTASMTWEGNPSSSVRPSRSRTPCSAASSYRSGFSESSLWVRSRPSGAEATMSVNVPPRSIQNCQAAAPGELLVTWSTRVIAPRRTCRLEPALARMARNERQRPPLCARQRTRTPLHAASEQPSAGPCMLSTIPRILSQVRPRCKARRRHDAARRAGGNPSGDPRPCSTRS